jgi:two-component system nitrogen regulation response regulator GlnG
MARARGGSIVFDEVADYDADTQARVVRMLDMLGDKAPRVMATSQVDLTARMEAGSFRQDLFYRLGGVTLHVPALRERVEDIPLLAEHFLPGASASWARPAACRRGARPDPRPSLARQRAAAGKHHPPAAGHRPETEIAKAEVERFWASSRQPNRCGRGEGDKLSASVART